MNRVTGNKERKKRKFSRKRLSKFKDGESIRNFLVLYRVLYVFYLLLLQKTKWCDAHV